MRSQKAPGLFYLALQGAHYGQKTVPILLDDINCLDYE